MSEHEHDELHVNEHHPHRRSDDRPAPPTRGAIPGNAAMAAMLGGSRVDRAATKQQGAGPLDDDIASDIRSARGGGQAMDETTQNDMESHLGVDLSGVRVHTGGQADQLSRSVQAEAFTTGNDIFFRSGRYQPSSSDGRRLLAHELTHVVQQSSGTGGAGGRVSHPDDPHEREASAVGDAVADAGPSVTPSSDSAPVAREAVPEEEPEDGADRQAPAPEDEAEEAADREAAAPEEEPEDGADREAAAPEEEAEEESAG